MNLVLACSTCFGASDDLLAKGANGGIYFLLAVLVLVLSGFLFLVFYLGAKEKKALNN